jgi:hypothetical protein
MIKIQVELGKTKWIGPKAVIKEDRPPVSCCVIDNYQHDLRRVGGRDTCCDRSDPTRHFPTID